MWPDVLREASQGHDSPNVILSYLLPDSEWRDVAAYVLPFQCRYQMETEISIWNVCGKQNLLTKIAVCKKKRTSGQSNLT